MTQARKGHITEEEMLSQLSAVKEERKFWEEELRKIQEIKAIKTKQEDILAQAEEASPS